LTLHGRIQSTEAGKELKAMIDGEDGKGKALFYYSPYKRTRETMDELRRHVTPSRIISEREEPRISEQQFGNFQDVFQVRRAKRERGQFGRFFYRFQSGEAGLDVYSRVSSFISTLIRDCIQNKNAGHNMDDVTVVIVTHGLSLRLFLMRWFQFSVEEFEASTNPDNAKLIIMEKTCVGDKRWYRLLPDDSVSLNLPECSSKNKDPHLHHLMDDTGL